MKNENNAYLNSFSKQERITCIAFIHLVANGFEKLSDLKLLNNLINNQINYLEISCSDVEIYFSNNEVVENLKKTLNNFNTFQKSLLVSLCVEILRYNNKDVSEHNYMIAENCFEKLADIYPKELVEIIERNNALSNGIYNLRGEK